MAFADLVDFSTISGDLPGGELGSLVGHFEELAIEARTGTGVRLVKTIGDAVMFVSSDADAALSAAMEIVTTAANDSVLPAARARDSTWVMRSSLGGDYFGRLVNVAARVTAMRFRPRLSSEGSPRAR